MRVLIIYFHMTHLKPNPNDSSFLPDSSLPLSQLTRDIDLLSRRFESPAWESLPPSARPSRPKTAPSRAPALHTGARWAAEGAAGGDRDGPSAHPDVQAHDDFLELHGPTGGWHPDDHAAWVRILALSRRDYTVAVEVACQEMAGVRREEVVRHARWHAELEELAFRKRSAIASWRARADREKEERMLEVRVGVGEEGG